MKTKYFYYAYLENTTTGDTIVTEYFDTLNVLRQHVKGLYKEYQFYSLWRTLDSTVGDCLKVGDITSSGLKRLKGG